MERQARPNSTSDALTPEGVTARTLANIEARLLALESVYLTGGAHRRLTVEQAAEAIGRSPETLRGWTRKREARAKYRVDVLLQKVAGRWESSPRNVAEWRRVMTDQLATAFRRCATRQRRS